MESIFAHAEDNAEERGLLSIDPGRAVDPDDEEEEEEEDEDGNPVVKKSKSKSKSKGAGVAPEVLDRRWGQWRD